MRTSRANSLPSPPVQPVRHRDPCGYLPDRHRPGIDVMGKKSSLRAEAKVDPQLKGFAYCDVVNDIDEVPSAVEVFQPLANRISDKPISDELMRVDTNFDYALEPDEFVFLYKVYPLVKIWGGL
jgi:hypothetical protein